MELQIDRMKSQDEAIKNLKEEINSITNQTSTIKGQIDNTKKILLLFLGSLLLSLWHLIAGLKLIWLFLIRKG